MIARAIPITPVKLDLNDSLRMAVAEIERFLAMFYPGEAINQTHAAKAIAGQWLSRIKGFHQDDDFLHLVRDFLSYVLSGGERSRVSDQLAYYFSGFMPSYGTACKHFTDLKRAEGWKIVEVEPSGIDLKPLAEQIHAARAIVKNQEIDTIVTARHIKASEYKELRKKQDASLDEQRQLQRFRVVQFYGVRDVSPELVKLDDNGRYRECVRLFSMFTASKTQWLWFTLSEQGQAMVDKKGYRPKCDLLQKLFHVAGVVDEAGAFNTMERFEGGNLNAFVALVRAETVNIGLVLGISVREDFEWKPISQLSEFLQLIGLKFGKGMARYVGGKKIYSYSLDLDRLEQTRAYSDHFRRSFKDGFWAWNVETEEWDLIIKEGKTITALERESTPPRDNPRLDE